MTFMFKLIALSARSKCNLPSSSVFYWHHWLIGAQKRGQLKRDAGGIVNRAGAQLDAFGAELLAALLIVVFDPRVIHGQAVDIQLERLADTVGLACRGGLGAGGGCRGGCRLADVLPVAWRRDKDGHGNWQDIGQPATAPAATASTEPAPASKPDSVSQPLKLDIDSLTVNNARVEYNDEQSGKQFSAESIQLSTGPVHDATSIPLKLTAFLGTNQPVMRVKTELDGKLRFDRALKRYQLEDMKVTGEASGEPLQGKTMTFAAQGQILVDLAANVAEWSSLKISANQLRALGELKANNLDSTPQISGGLSIAQLDLARFLDSIGHPLPAMAPGSLSKVELVSRLSGTPTSVTLDELNLKVDDSTFTGLVAIDDFAKQAVRIQLKGDTFDADRYMPPKSAEANSASVARKAEVQGSEAGALAASGDTPLPDAPTKSGWSTAKIIPVTRLKALDLNADISFGQLTLTNCRSRMPRSRPAARPAC